jgi:hypothetical protein
MNKRSFGLTVLVSLLVIVIIFYAIIAGAMKDGGKKTETPSGGGIYLDRQASEVEKITYRTGGETFTVRRDGSIYVLDEDNDFPLDTTALGYMTNALALITYERKINPEGNDLSDYGLTEPQAIIDALYTDGARLTLTVGNYNAYSGAFYCSTGDGFIYLMGGEFSEAFEYTFHDLILHDYVEAPQYGFSSVTKLEITSGSKRVFFELVDEENGIWSKNGDVGEFSYDVMNIYNELYKLSVTEWVAYNADTDAELEPYGLKTPEIRVVFTHTETEEIEIEGSSPVTKEYERQTAFLIGSRTADSDESDPTRYFLFGGGGIVYIVYEESFECTIEAIK